LRGEREGGGFMSKSWMNGYLFVFRFMCCG
jgi:hypothetical protein